MEKKQKTIKMFSLQTRVKISQINFLLSTKLPLNFVSISLKCNLCNRNNLKKQLINLKKKNGYTLCSNR